jgi:serine/threonine protein kinase
MSTSQPPDDSAIPLIHESEAAAGSSFPGLEDAPTQVRPHSALASSPTVPVVGEPVPAASAQVLGARLDHFELLDSIGVGGMGRVFRARDTRLDRLVALKVLSPELSTDPEICRRFEQEAKAAARLDDRHFARVYFFGFDKGLRYIAMEYVEGENVRQKINKLGKLPVPLVLNVGIQIAQGLAHAASCGVVHRDIKPSNIILTPDGTAKLVDMGLARNFFQQSSPASELTQAGVTLGTFDYISPEQALDPRDADVRSDIYSLGCTLYHAITGQPPFSKGSALQKILQHQNDSVPDPRRWVPDLPESIVSVLNKMLAKDPKDRYQHPVELIEDLRAVSYSLEIPLPEEATYRPAIRTGPGFWENHLTWILPLGVLLAALGVYAWFDQPGGSSGLTRSPATEAMDSGIPSGAVGMGASPRGLGRPRDERIANEPAGSERRRVVVPVDGDLAQAIKQAVTGTEILLAGNRYVLADGGDGAGIRSILLEKEIRIEPESPTGLTEIEVRSGVWNGRTNGEGSSLLRIRGESVEMRRLAWVVKGTGDSSSARALFSVAGGRLTLEDCFVRIAGGSREEPLTIVQLEASEARRIGALKIQRTIFHGADEAIRIVSPSNSEIELTDCAFDQTTRSPFRLEGLGDVTWSMDHVTVRSLQTPLFRIQRLGGVRIQARDCVFAHASKSGEPETAFVDFQTDGTWTSNTDSWWSGRGNLFHDFHPMTISRGGQAIARSLRQARPLGFDETVLLAVERPTEIWASSADTPLAVSSDSGLQIADRLRLLPEYVERDEGPIGCRKTPWGPMYGPRAVAESKSATEAPDSPAGNGVASLLVVDPTAKEGAERNVFVRWGDAMAQVGVSGAIEIRVNGLVDVSPASCRGKSLVVRSAPGYSPVLMWDATAAGAKTDSSLFELDHASKLTLDGIALLVRTDGEKSLGVASMEPGAELVVQDSSVQIDGGLMKSKALLAKGSTGVGETSESVAKVQLVRSTVRTSGSVFSSAWAVGGTLTLTDAFVVAARPVVTLDGPSLDRSFQLQVDKATLLLGESLVACPMPEAGASGERMIRVTTRDSLILGYGTAPMQLSTSAGPGGDMVPSLWSSERTFVAGFTHAWGELISSMEKIELKLSMNDFLTESSAFQGTLILGTSNPFVLGAGGIKTVQVPLVSQLKRLGYPNDSSTLLGVAAQVLPPEPTPSYQR